jgi:hypothetical protein
MNTKLVTEWNMSLEDVKRLELTFEQVCDQFVADDTNLFLADKNNGNGGAFFALLYSEYQKVSSVLNSKRWVTLTDEIYFDKKAGGAWILEANNEDYLYKIFDSGKPLTEVEDYINEILKDPINQWGVPTFKQLKYMTNLEGIIPFEYNKDSKRVFLGDYVLYAYSEYVQGFDCHVNFQKSHDTGLCIPFLKFSNDDLSDKQLFIALLKKGLTPIALAESQGYQILLSRFNLKSNTEQQLVAEKFVLLQYEQMLIHTLLNEDKIRADIAPYHQKMVEDTEQGHWSLWPTTQNSDNQAALLLVNQLVACDPKSSINDGVVAIDFGTKSTVVVYQKENVNIHPMRIGTGDLSKEIAAFHYENPTIMEFNDLDRFITDYQSKPNKPYTRWQDLTISHTAQNAMHGCESSQFNTFLAEIKQWAGDKNRKLKIVGKQGKVIDLPAFLDIGENDFNPIEIYAYYLGLYINNQNNGIYLDYILSFPVTYEMPIRDKIIESFERGLQKSLPEELGEEALAQLTVTKGASEPAAYALVALQSYDFDPCDDERVFYGVFDFGGGTTDFDFGIFREANGKKERRFDYAIEHFGAGGDKFLGGENLLELLAFEVFKKNKTALLSKGIQFEKHPEKDAFAGSEQLINSSQEAKINTKTLCEKLRPFWEGDSESAVDLSQGSLSINLTDVNAIVYTAFELDVDVDELNKILFDRIEQGVINFFNALRLAFSNSNIPLQDIDNINIFLAGNSSKSNFVKDIFDKQIALQHEEMDVFSEKESRFKLYQPLGAEKNDVEKPTGKTGVAFGLIESREGGRIKVIDHNVTEDDIRFKFYLGESRKNNFKVIIDREIDFSRWVEFIDASCQKFELFYTEQPSASTGKMPVSDSSIKKSVIKLDMTDDEAMVYMRVVSPTKVEYVVAHEDAIASENYLNEIQSIELS